MIRRAASRLHIVRVSKTSLMKKTTVVPSRYNTALESSDQCFSTGIGHDVSLLNISSSSFEGGSNVSMLVDDHGDAAINEMSTTPLDHESDNVGQHNCGQYTEALGTVSTSDCHTISVHSDTLCQYSPASQIEKGQDQDRDLSTSAETGVPTATSRHQTAVPLHTPVAKYRCATETYGYTQVRVGTGEYIPRWRRGSELIYTVNVKSFPTLAKGMQVKAAMQEAISMWRGIGARFCFEDLEVDNYGSATFVVRYYPSECTNAYARAFFPDEVPGELLVYNLALSNAPHLANILAHEIGHILGLRHEFAEKDETRLRCILFGENNPRSIMNYYKDPGQLQVSEQDLRELKEFYAHDEAMYEGLPIRHCVPISRPNVPISHPKKTRRFSC